MKIAISRVHYPVHSLGPGSRVGIWFQGCSIRCQGCISADTWAPDRGIVTLDSLFDGISAWLRHADGVTISGGEPFDQPESLAALLSKLRRIFDGDILVYSGYTWEALAPKLMGLEGLLDALLTDPFDAQSPQSLPLRGSDNQRLFILTPLGRERFQDYEGVLRKSDETLDVMFDDATGEIWFAGIPRQGDFRRLSDFLRASGHVITTTEDKR